MWQKSSLESRIAYFDCKIILTLINESGYIFLMALKSVNE